MTGLILLLVLGLFLCVQLYLWWMWNVERDFSCDSIDGPLPSLSIVVAVRNEIQHIQACIESLLAQEYPGDPPEIIIVDDHSTDDTVKILEKYPSIHIFSLPEGQRGKKLAVTAGVNRSAGEVILTTDGDCIVGRRWAWSMVSVLTATKAELVTGPIVLTASDHSSFIQRYQILEHSSLNILTWAGIKTGLLISANGANMGFRRHRFMDTGPYSDNMNTPSGDDVFLAQKIMEEGGIVSYARHQDAMVYTEATIGLGSMMQQRLRWAGKSPAYTHRPTQIYLLMFALMNLILLSLMLCSVWNIYYLSFLVYGLLLKFVIDYLLIGAGMRWMGRSICWQDVLKASLFQVVYVVYVVILMVLGKKGKWKGRS